MVSSSHDNTGNRGFSVDFDGSLASDMTVTIGAFGIYILNKSNRSEARITDASWRMRLKVWK